MTERINKYFIYLSLFIIDLALRINNHKICAFIIWLNIRKSKKIKSRFKNAKKVLVFPKSGGYDDLIESFFNKKNNNIVFYLLPRTFLKKIFSYYFGIKHEVYVKDYYTKLKNLDELNKKKLYVKFLTLTFRSINDYLKLDAFVSFNLFYYSEKYFEEVCKNLNSKFIILHKESVFTPIEELMASVIYKKYNERSLSYKISVYSESQKKMLIKSKIANKKQVFVNGNPRCDYSFRLRKVKPKKKIIVFYLIEYNRNNNVFIRNKKKNWKKLYNQTLKYVLEFAKNNPNIEVILKGKTGIHKKNHFNSKLLSKNCLFIEGGSGQKLLKDASVVIAFNSTIVFETILSNRNLIIPNFNNENKLNKNILLNIKNKKYFANTKKQFNKKINLNLKLGYKNKKLSKNDIDSLKYYVGNIDGNSGIKVQKFFKTIFY